MSNIGFKHVLSNFRFKLFQNNIGLKCLQVLVFLELICVR